MMTSPLGLFLPHPHHNHHAKILHRRSLVILLGLFITAQSIISLVSTFYPKILGYASFIPPEQIVKLTNQYRAKQGLNQLKINSKLSQAAMAKAADMFARGYWAHNAPDGTQPWSFIVSSGYSYLHAGENLARDFSDPSDVVEAWKASPTHNANLISSKYKDIGVAVMDGKLDGVDTTLVVQMFGSLPSSAPKIAIGENTIQKALAADDTQGELSESIGLNVQKELLISPFDLSRTISLSFVLLLLCVLALDWFIVLRRGIVRVTGKSWAHLTYLVTLFLILIILKQGIIL